MGCPIGREWKGYEMIWLDHYITMTFDPTHDWP